MSAVCYWFIPLLYNPKTYYNDRPNACKEKHLFLFGRAGVNLLNLRFRGPCIVSIFVLIYFQRDATLHSLFISGKLLYMFRMVSSPIIRSTYNCIYSTRNLLTITAVCLYCGRVGVGQTSSNSPKIEADNSNG